MLSRFSQLCSRFSALFSSGTILLIILAGGLVGGNFSITKFVVTSGVSPLAALFWMLVVASGILIASLVVTKRRLDLSGKFLSYYVISGFLGIVAPQYLSYLLLKEIPVSFFTVLVTLSPLFTVIITSIYERKWVSLNRTIGILLGLAGVFLATYSGFDLSKTDSGWLSLSIAVPVLLGVTNLYRSKAYPFRAHPMPLAAGTLLSQVIFLIPVLAYTGEFYAPFDFDLAVNWALLATGVVTAISYFLTYELQRRTDGIGFSQVGYFVTVFGVVIGALVFDEPLSPLFMISVLLLFLGLFVTNDQIKLISYNQGIKSAYKSLHGSNR